MEEWPGTVRRRRGRRLRWRRVGALCAVALMASALYLFLGVGVTTNGSQEWIGGRSDTHDLLLPMALFILGMLGLAACLP